MLEETVLCIPRSDEIWLSNDEAMQVSLLDVVAETVTKSPRSLTKVQEGEVIASARSTDGSAFGDIVVSVFVINGRISRVVRDLRFDGQSEEPSDRFEAVTGIVPLDRLRLVFTSFIGLNVTDLWGCGSMHPDLDLWCNPTSPAVIRSVLSHGFEEFKSFVRETFWAFLNLEEKELGHDSSLRLFGVVEVELARFEDEFAYCVRGIRRGTKRGLMGMAAPHELGLMLTDFLDGVPDYVLRNSEA